MSRLFIMRHGEAVSMAANDSLRPLTSLGRRQAQSVAQWFKQREIIFQHVFVSPYVRAQQTWQVMAETIDFQGEVRVEPNLKPNGRITEVVEILSEYLSSLPNNILVVSHLPLVGYLVQELSRSAVVPMFATAATAELVLSDTLGSGTYSGIHLPMNE